MKLLIDNPASTLFSEVFNQTGDIAIVTQSPILDPLEKNKLLNLFDNRICSIHFITEEVEKVNEDTNTVKFTTPIRALRIGWKRVQKELDVFCPQVKRVFVMVDTAALRVVIPALPKSSSTEIANTHGTLFKLNNRIIVPSFKLDVANRLDINQYFLRDVARCLKLTRPDVPLPFSSGLAGFLQGHRGIVEHLVIDLETTGLNPVTDKITSIGLQWSEKDRCIVTEEIDETIAYLVNHMPKNVWFHNAQFDLGFMGDAFRKAVYGRVRDTMIRSKARGELVNSLKHLGNLYTNRPGNYAWLEDTFDYDDPSYICEDLDVTWKLSRLWIKEDSKPVVELFERIVVMAAEQTILGSAIDVEALKTLAKDGAKFVEEKKIELTEKYGVDPNHQIELCDRLIEMGYDLRIRTKADKYALDKKILEELGLHDLLEYRAAQKLDSSFVAKIKSLMREDGTLPHNQNMMNAETGRSTMSDFNWQQAGRKGPVRGLLISRFVNGLIASVDLARAELVAACYLSKDEVMAKALLENDVHKVIASNAFEIHVNSVDEEQRYAAKTTGFRTIYGGVPITEAQKRVYKYMQGTFRKLFKWINQTKNLAMQNNEITDPWGKTRNLLNVLVGRGKYGVGRAGINSPVQGLASHWALYITLRIWVMFKELGLNSLVLFGVHDSTVIDVFPGEEETVTHIIQKAFRDLGAFNTKFFPSMAHILPVTGELQYGVSLAHTKEGNKILCSSL